MRASSKIFSVILSALIPFIVSATSAASLNVLEKENMEPNADALYWTPERLRDAKPLPLPKVREGAAREIRIENLPHNGDSDGGDGAPPSAQTKPILEHLFTPKTETPSISSNARESNLLFDRGTLNDNFSSSRLIPLAADRVYPYTTVGKLFFTKPDGGNFVCSASVIRHRILLTAGHCVHRGSGGVDGFYSKFLFIPAFRDGVAPFQSWNWKYVIVTGTWATGNGGVPNGADYAMLELEDRSFVGITRRIGEVTGYLGYQTQSLIPNHAHMLGYPCNLDGCQKMHQVTAQSARAVAPNNAQYGSDMRGGSSGGPWVQNFGALADGQTGGTNPGRNRVIGITSWGYVDTAPKSQGSSIPDSRFTDILNTACAHKAGNCS